MKIYCLKCKKFVEAPANDELCPECNSNMCGLGGLIDKLPDYEKDAAHDIIVWANQPPGKVTKAINKTVDAIAGKVGKAVPKWASDEITKYVISILEFLQGVSFYTYINDKVKLEKDLEEKLGNPKLAAIAAQIICSLAGKGVIDGARKNGYPVNTISDLKTIHLEQNDKLVGQYMGLLGNKSLATIEGGLAGIWGWPLLVIDVPLLITLNYRFIQQIGTCYGYDQDLPQEKAYTNQVFMLALGSDSGIGTGVGSKTYSTYQLRSLAYALSRNWTYAQMTKKGGLAAALAWLKKNAPKEAAKFVTKRKAAAALPIIGSGVGAVINYTITSNTGKVAWNCYRYRKILETHGGLEGCEQSFFSPPEE